MSELGLSGKIKARLVFKRRDRAKRHVSERDVQVLVDEIAGVDVKPVAFVGKALVAGLGAVFNANNEAGQKGRQIAERAFELRVVIVVEVAAEADDASLVGLGEADGGVDQDAGFWK